MQFKVKAGKFSFNKQTKKVKFSKQKGFLRIHINEQEQVHFRWVNLQTNIEQLDIIVFPNDAIFQPVIGINNAFVLRFGMDDQRYFFWLQEKIDCTLVVKQINKIINTTPQQHDQQIIPQSSQPQNQQPPQKPQQKSQTKPQPHHPTHQQPKHDPGLVTKLIQDLTSMRKQTTQNNIIITHLNEIITSDALNTILKQLNETDLKQLIEYMPPEHQNITLIPSTLRSPQFQQALDVLSDALNSQNILPLFMQLGLNQQFLKANYGVQAFLLALIEKSKKK